MKKRTLFLSALILSIFFITGVSALGEWEQYQRDERMNPYSALSGFYHQNQNTTSINYTISLQPLVNDFNGERILVIVATNNLIVYDSNLILKDSHNLTKTINAITTYDWDGDGNTEIIMLVDNNLTSKNFTVYEYVASSSTLTLEKQISIMNYSFGFDSGNIICGEFVGTGDCIFANGGDLNHTFIFVFNHTSNIQADNPLHDFNNLKLDLENQSHYLNEMGEVVLGYHAKKIFLSLVDLDDDGDNEINFAVSGTVGVGSPRHKVNKFISINNDLEVQLNFSFYGWCGVPTDYSVFLESVIVKVENLYGDSKPEIIIAVELYNGGDASTNLLGSGLSVYNNSGGFKYSRCYYSKAETKYCPQRVDFAIYDNKIYAFSNYIGETLSSDIPYSCGFDVKHDSSLELDIIEITESGVTSNAYFNSTIVGKFDYNLELADFDNDGEIEFLTQYGIADIEDYGTQELPFILTGDIVLISGTAWNDAVSGIGRFNIPADLDGDYQLDIISTGNTTSKGIYYNPVYSNLAPRITTLFWTPTNPVCIGNNVGYSVNYSDSENDSIYMRTDCYGNGSYTTSNLSDNPTASCNMSALGNYNAEICIRDLYHGTWASCSNHQVTVALTNCFYTYETFGNSSLPTGAEANAFGFYTARFEPTIDGGYTSAIFDWSLCEGWTMLYGLCPVWIWIMGLGTVVWNFIFTTFWLFLIFILIIVILAFLKKKYLNQ